MNELFASSVGVIKGLQASSGGLLATPADGAYPFVYVRDGVFMARALDAAGERGSSERFYRFLFDVQDADGSWEHRYLPDGYPATSRVNETDCAGLVLSGVFEHFKSASDDSLLREYWPSLERAAEYILAKMKDGLVYCVHSVHEYKPLEEGLEVWCNCACFRGLADFALIAQELGMDAGSERISSAAEKLGAAIVERFWDEKTRDFIKCIRPDGTKISYPDVSCISPLYFGVTGYDGREGMLERYDELLWDKNLGGYLKFRRMEGVTDWHWYTGGFGPWVVHTLQMASVFRSLGRLEDALRCMNWVEESAAFAGLLPEHVSSESDYLEWKNNEYEFSERIRAGIRNSEEHFNGAIPWALPLGWSHAEYVLAAARIKNGV